MMNSTTIWQQSSGQARVGYAQYLNNFNKFLYNNFKNVCQAYFIAFFAQQSVYCSESVRFSTSSKTINKKMPFFPMCLIVEIIHDNFDNSLLFVSHFL